MLLRQFFFSFQNNDNKAISSPWRTKKKQCPGPVEFCRSYWALILLCYHVCAPASLHFCADHKLCNGSKCWGPTAFPTEYSVDPSGTVWHSGKARGQSTKENKRRDFDLFTSFKVICPVTERDLSLDSTSLKILLAVAAGTLLMQTTTLEFVYSSSCLSLFCVVAFLLFSKLIDSNMYYPKLTEHFKWQHYGNFIVKFRNISVLYRTPVTWLFPCLKWSFNFSVASPYDGYRLIK